MSRHATKVSPRVRYTLIWLVAAVFGLANCAVYDGIQGNDDQPSPGADARPDAIDLDVSQQRDAANPTDATAPGTQDALPNPTSSGNFAALRLKTSITDTITAGSPFSVEVRLVDAQGNTVDTSATVELELRDTSGSSAPLSGTTSMQADAGIATFNDIAAKKAGSHYKIHATVDNYWAEGDEFSVQPAAPSPTRSTLTADPTSNLVANGTDLATISVAIKDEYDNPLSDNIVVLSSQSEDPGAHAMGVSYPPEDNTDDKGEVTFEVSANAMAGTAVVQAVVRGPDNQEITLNDTATLEFIEPKVQILVDVNYLPAEFELSLNINEEQKTITTSGVSAISEVPRNSDYTLSLTDNAEIFCELQGTYGGRITADTTVAIQCFDQWKTVSASKTNWFVAAIRKDGTLWTWGRNNNGQLGDGTSTAKSKPTRVGDKTDWVNVSAGGAHVLALDAAGTLWGWGDNRYRQLSILVEAGVWNEPKPILNPRSLDLPSFNPSSWAHFAAGNEYSVAVLRPEDGSPDDVVIWGINGATGDVMENNYLVTLKGCGLSDTAGCEGPDEIDHVSAGTSFAVIVGHLPTTLDRPNEVIGAYWGLWSNNYGQLGLGDWEMREDHDNVRLEISQQFQMVDAGDYSTVGISYPDGKLYVWGLLHGSSDGGSSNSPTPLQPSVPFQQASAGYTHYLAIQSSDGALYSWGEAFDGELGTSIESYRRVRPTLENRSVSYVSAGYSASFILDANKPILFARGSNTYGQLGIGATQDDLPSTADFVEVKTNP